MEATQKVNPLSDFNSTQKIELGEAPLPDLKTAYEACQKLAREHYENFPVASLMLPKALRPHVAAVYAFSRIADDFADEAQYEGVRMARLKEWEEHLKKIESAVHPVFVALKDTIQKFAIPTSLFQDLITAFKMDVVVSRYQTFDQVLNYCRYSANPVGRIVLYIMGYPAPRFLECSDHICTALQLTNFWQDVSVDLLKNRIYIPREDMMAFDYDEETLQAKVYNQKFKRLISFQVDRTEELFHKGKYLLARMPGRLGLELKMTWLGGMKILQKIRDLEGDVLTTRPALGKRDVLGMFVGALNKKKFLAD